LAPKPIEPDRLRAEMIASVAGLLITTEAMVAELPKKQGSAMPGGAGSGMGGMGGMDF
jgi:chaperonin GroEL